MPAHGVTRPVRTGIRRRSGAGSGSPSCGRSFAAPGGRLPTSPHAAPCTRRRRTPRSTRGTGTGGTRDTRRSSTRSIPTPRRPTAREPRRCRSCAARSHSASVGRRLPAHRANASASYQHTCCTGSSSGRSSRRPKRVRDHDPEPSRVQNCGAASRPSPRHAHPAWLHHRSSSYPPASTNSRYSRLRDRCPIDEKRRAVPLVTWTLVVERPGVVGAHHERTAGDHQGPRRRSGTGVGCHGPAAGWAKSSMSWSVASMVSSCWCSCCTTIAVARTRRAGADRRRRDRARARLEDPARGRPPRYARAHRPEDRQRRPLGARVAERVVHVVERLVDGRRPGDRAQEPQLLVVADVREVPHQRRHQRRHLTGECVVVERLEQCGRARPRDSSSAATRPRWSSVTPM